MITKREVEASLTKDTGYKRRLQMTHGERVGLFMTLGMTTGTSVEDFVNSTTPEEIAELRKLLTPESWR